MFTYLGLAAIFFLAGVVVEHRFSVFERTLDLTFILAVIIIDGLEAFGRWLRGVWHWLLRPLLWFVGVAALAGLVTLVAGFFTSLGLPELPSVAPTASSESWSLWAVISAVIITVLAGIAAGLWALLEAIWWLFSKLLTALLLGLTAFLPTSCQQEPEVMAVPRSEIGTAYMSPKPDHADVFQPREGEGCIRITRRAGYPLSLKECVALAERSKLQPVQNAQGYVEAPRTFPADEFYHYRDGSWAYLRR